MVGTFEQMTIKHSMYMQKVPFLCTERACVVFSSFGILIENAQRLFQGSLFGCFEYVPYTSLTIVLIIKTINVRLD